MIESNTPATLVFEVISKAIRSKNKSIKLLIILAAISLIIAITSYAIGKSLTDTKVVTSVIAAIFGGITALIVLGLAGYFQSLDKAEEKQKYEVLEKKTYEHPEETRAAWDLARIKLESYLNRNLAHIRWIFILILFVMSVGFGIIIYGIIKVYQSPELLNPSIVVTCSGVLIEFIAATFLIIYRSIMTQAKEYVNVLERINAVGMSVQILDSISTTDPQLKDKTRSELVKELLSLYKK